MIVGTAGHIDHGKSSLVRRLTGVDPDRLKEEQARGMTIDLGFAPYRTESAKTVGIIDVPGHEKFVKNMVAGACSVAIFLLVVAADDGVMPQTREHVEILDLLGARQGIVAVTKIDLVDQDLRELAMGEIEEYLAGTPFADAPLLPISTTTEEGIPELRACLDRMIDATECRGSEGLFRMPVQRVFSAAGHGTILTGVPVSGSVRLGESLEVLPHGFTGKVRAIEAYREKREDAHAGHSTALNLSDVDYRRVRRGDVVGTPGSFRPARLFEAELRYLESAPRPLKHGGEVRLHLGTAESLARVVLLDVPVLEPGDTGLVQFRLRDPLVAVRGDPFLIRQTSPMITLGGGTIVAESIRRMARGRKEAIESVRAKLGAIADPPAYLSRLLLERQEQAMLGSEIPVVLKCRADEAARLLNLLRERGEAVELVRGRWIHRQVFAACRERLLAGLERFHAENRLRASCEVLALRREAGMEGPLLEGMLKQLEASGHISSHGGGRVALAGFAPRLEPQESALLERLGETLELAGLTPPSLADLVQEAGAPKEMVEALLRLMVDQGMLKRTGEIYFATSQVERALQIVKTVAREAGGEILVPKLRDAMGTTRKFLIPLLEHFDSNGLTVRRGERRFFVEQAAESSG